MKSCFSKYEQINFIDVRTLSILKYTVLIEIYKKKHESKSSQNLSSESQEKSAMNV